MLLPLTLLAAVQGTAALRPLEPMDLFELEGVASPAVSPDGSQVLYARVGKGHCPRCRRQITAQTRQQILQQIAGLPAGTRFQLLAPLIRAQKGEYRDLFEDLALRAAGSPA